MTSPNASPREVLRTAAEHIDPLDRIEATAVTADTKNRLGNSIIWLLLFVPLQFGCIMSWSCMLLILSKKLHTVTPWQTLGYVIISVLTVYDQLA